ncbi:FAD-dependent oxidoreductase domain-containing protein 1-like [Oscarella lobularis]|uniref:FAD-dependent oxidoreductase domain-containing protein 1-like n=1 Tax=Oscarella lobularis TaxID=121494 RepID=UPI003313C555
MNLGRIFARRLHYDVCIVGGGIMGSSSAYFLANKIAPSSIRVVERDATYARASTVLSAGSIRQQFSVPGNVRMSLYGSEFLKNVDEHLNVDANDACAVPVVWGGYLFLATSAGEQRMRENHVVQKSVGADVALLSPRDMATRFPWLNCEGLSLGSFGESNEGWFDPWLLLSAFRKKALSMGVSYQQGTVTGIEVNQNQAKSIQVLNSNNETETITCNYLINCAGAWAANVARMAGIGNENSKEEILRVGLPVRPRKRMIFAFKCNEKLSSLCPLIIDPSGFYVRQESEQLFISGKSPTEDQDPDEPELDVEHEFFDNEMWPYLAERIPAFNAIKVQNAWAGYYDYNTLDQNAVIGRHPLIQNFIFANGFSGHGVMQSPAAGRAVSEIVVEGKSTSIDLEEFGFNRIIENRPLKEKNII